MKIEEAIRGINGVSSRDDLRDKIWLEGPDPQQGFNGEIVTELAKNLSWNHYPFESRREVGKTPNPMILESKRGTKLAVLSPNGKVYQLGDIVQFETVPASGAWSYSKSKEPITYEGRITHISKYSITVSRKPTYSNTPNNSPSFTPSDESVTIISRKNLDDYRERFEKGVYTSFPKSANGWKLTNFEIHESHTSLESGSNGTIKEMVWSNGESTTIRAKWRYKYNCWYLSTPEESVLTEANSDEHLYEIDTPQNVVKTETIVNLAEEAMRSLDPNDFQDPYDLRNAKSQDNPIKFSHGFVPTTIPDQIGDWKCIDRRHNTLKWKNINKQSVWHNFEVKLTSNANITIWNGSERTAHDRRYIRKHNSDGEPHPDNIGVEDYRHKSRDMWNENYHYAFAFMIQTSKTDINQRKVTQLNEEATTDIPLSEINHGLSENAMDTMDRQDANLLAYT